MPANFQPRLRTLLGQYNQLATRALAPDVSRLSWKPTAKKLEVLQEKIRTRLDMAKFGVAPWVQKKGKAKIAQAQAVLMKLYRLVEDQEMEAYRAKSKKSVAQSGFVTAEVVGGEFNGKKMRGDSVLGAHEWVEKWAKKSGRGVKFYIYRSDNGQMLSAFINTEHYHSLRPLDIRLGNRREFTETATKNHRTSGAISRYEILWSDHGSAGVKFLQTERAAIAFAKLVSTYPGVASYAKRNASDARGHVTIAARGSSGIRKIGYVVLERFHRV